MSGKEIIDNISINEENQKDIDDTDQIKTNINTSMYFKNLKFI